eukprot:12646001-Ditylum_brightwellii.AAC.1
MRSKKSVTSETNNEPNTRKVSDESDDSESKISTKKQGSMSKVTEVTSSSEEEETGSSEEEETSSSEDEETSKNYTCLSHSSTVKQDAAAHHESSIDSVLTRIDDVVREDDIPIGTDFTNEEPIKRNDSFISAGSDIVTDVLSYVMWPAVLKEDCREAEETRDIPSHVSPNGMTKEQHPAHPENSVNPVLTKIDDVVRVSDIPTEVDIHDESIKSNDSLLSAGSEIVTDAIGYVFWPKVLKEDPKPIMKRRVQPQCHEKVRDNSSH